MDEMIDSKDHNINLLKFDLKITGEHVIRKNDLTKTCLEDNTLEIFICEQDEFRDKHIARAEILYSDFVNFGNKESSKVVERHIIF